MQWKKKTELMWHKKIAKYNHLFLKNPTKHTQKKDLILQIFGKFQAYCSTTHPC